MAFTLDSAWRRIAGWPDPRKTDGPLLTGDEWNRLATNYERLHGAEEPALLAELGRTPDQFQRLKGMILPYAQGCFRRDVLPTFHGKLLAFQPHPFDLDWYGERGRRAVVESGSVVKDKELMHHLAHLRILQGVPARRLSLEDGRHRACGGWASSRGVLDVDMHTAEYADRAWRAVRAISKHLGPSAMVLRSSLGMRGTRGFHVHVKVGPPEVGVIALHDALVQMVVEVVGQEALKSREGGGAGYIEVYPRLDRLDEPSSAAALRLPLGYGAAVLDTDSADERWFAGNDPRRLIRLFMEWFDGTEVWREGIADAEERRDAALAGEPVDASPAPAEPRRDEEEAGVAFAAGGAAARVVSGGGLPATDFPGDLDDWVKDDAPTTQRFDRETIVVEGIPAGSRWSLLPSVAAYFAGYVSTLEYDDTMAWTLAQAADWIYLRIHGSEDITTKPDRESAGLEERIKAVVEGRSAARSRTAQLPRGEVPVSADLHDRLAAAVRKTVGEEDAERAFSIVAHAAAWVRFHRRRGAERVPLPVGALTEWGAVRRNRSDPLYYMKVRGILEKVLGLQCVKQGRKRTGTGGDSGGPSLWTCLIDLDGEPEMVATARRRLFPRGRGST